MDTALTPWPEAIRQAVEGLSSLDSGLRSCPGETIPLSDAVGRILAEAITLDRDEPPASRSAMDGFAVRAADGDGDRRLVGAVHAGTSDFPEVGPGEASKVMTGGTIPPGADAVVPVERTSTEGETVSFSIAPEAGAHIRKLGEMGAAGKEVVPAGALLGPGDLGVAAGCGADPVLVRARPRVAVISTGDEVVAWNLAPEPHQVRDSNRLVVSSQAEAAGAEVVMAERIPDRIDALEAGVETALGQADLVVTLGGVSMGEKDHLPGVFSSLGVEKIFHGVDVQPGKPLWCGRREGVSVLGLPGNPVSAFAVFEIFGIPILQALLGLAPPGPRPMESGILGSDARSKGRPLFLPASVAPSPEGDNLVTPRPWTGSGDWTALCGATALLHLPPRTDATSGDPVDFLRLS